MLADSDLASFLFGSESSTLAGFARVLRDHQRGRCLYCAREVPKSAAEVDHFIAWSRYPIDLGHNLVLAHRGCNAKKRDFLAHPMHVASWYRSHLERGDDESPHIVSNGRLPGLGGMAMIVSSARQADEVASAARNVVTDRTRDAQIPPFRSETLSAWLPPFA